MALIDTEEYRLGIVRDQVVKCIKGNPEIVRRKVLPSKNWEECELRGFTIWDPPPDLLLPAPEHDLGHLEVDRGVRDRLVVFCRPCGERVKRSMVVEPIEKTCQVEQVERPQVTLRVVPCRVGSGHPSRPWVVQRHWDYVILTGQCKKCLTIHHGYASLK